ncbi:MAG: hypothetical protein ACRELY_28230 [Polyangiaceae bacterium]
MSDGGISPFDESTREENRHRPVVSRFSAECGTSLFSLARPDRFERSTTGLEGQRFSGKLPKEMGSRDPDVTPLLEALLSIEEGHPAALRIATDALGYAVKLLEARAVERPKRASTKSPKRAGGRGAR